MVIGDDQRCQINARRDEFKIVNHFFIVVIGPTSPVEGSSAEERGAA